MKNLWNPSEAAAIGKDPLSLRVYTSRLLGRDPSLVLHGGGNTSVKIEEKNLFGETESLLYVKGSGWDLATIRAQGFAPVKMDTLLKMAHLENLSDNDMVRVQKSAMTDPGAPAPSVEAILHAIIPYRFVDHTHADAVVAITNTPDGEAAIRKIYGDLIESMVEYGLKGIEVYCHGHSSSYFRKYKEIAKKYGLISCGGADFHIRREDDRFSPGSLKIPYEVLGKLKNVKEGICV